MDKNSGFNTKMVHGGIDLDEFGSVNVPIYQSSTFAFKSAKQGADRFAGKEEGYIYTRIANPTIKALENNIALLEKGYGAIATSSGMGAVTSIYMAILEQGSHMISTASVYGPSRMIMENHFSRFGVEYSYVDTSKVDNILPLIQPNTKMLFIETPSNPTMQLTDLKACSKIAKEHDLVLVVDNTFSSPYLQNPIDLGADLVFHSVTKFINGHADIVGGIIIASTEEMYKKVRPLMVNLGFNMDPHQAFMVLRGVKTLSLRVEKAQESAGIIAEWLENHPKVKWVKYPGLKSYPQRELALKQMHGFGSMISFELKGGLKSGGKLMDNMKLALLAVSLGGVETLIQHPASMTHSAIPHKERISAGISDGLVRLAVGIENVEDLIKDLRQALEKI